MSKSFWSFFYEEDKSALTEISEEDYQVKFLETMSKEQLKSAYEKAWEAKNFEINNYWKRGTYFWAFQVASFTGYFAVRSSKYYTIEPELLYFVTCIGIITSLAWLFVNKGSKIWQRHWEIHVDLLEEKITGPLYKIVTTTKTYSVSKINEIVSWFFVLIWIIMGLKYLVSHVSIFVCPCQEGVEVKWWVLISTAITIAFISAMQFGHGRGRFGKRDVELYIRDTGQKNKNSK